MKLLQINFCYKLVFFNWMGTFFQLNGHPPFIHPPPKYQNPSSFRWEPCRKKIVIWLLTKCLQKGVSLVANPKQCLQRFLTLVVMYLTEYMVYCSWQQFNENTTKLQSIIHINSISIAQYTFQIHISILYFNLNLQFDQFISIPFGYK